MNYSLLLRLTQLINIYGRLLVSTRLKGSAAAAAGGKNKGGCVCVAKKELIPLQLYPVRMFSLPHTGNQSLRFKAIAIASWETFAL